MKTAITFALSLLSLVLTALALRVIWNWHVVPLGLPAITTWHALGLSAGKSALFYALEPADFSTMGKWSDEQFHHYLISCPLIQVAMLGLFVAVAWIAK
jgi:hypothetical protein